MRTLREPGWYCDGTVIGRRVQLVRDSHIVIDDRWIIPWPGNVDCLVMSRDGWLAGSVQRERDYAVVFDGVTWHELGGTVGRNPCAFSPDGRVLYVCRGGWVSRYALPDLERDDFPMETGALGIRHITADGRIVTCEETYNEPTRTIYEFTDVGGWRIGHGNDRVGCLVQGPDGIYRLLEAGEAKFVQAHCDGDQFCIAFHLETAKPPLSVWYWLTRDELLALPPLALDPDPGTHDPDPATPTPEGPPMSIWTDAHTALLVRFAAKVPPPAPLPKEPKPTQAEEDAWDAAWRSWTGKFAKQLRHDENDSWGHKRADPNRPPSADCVAYKWGSLFVGFDLRDGGTGALVTRPGQIDLTGQTFVPVEPFDYLGANPVPDPDPPVDPPVDTPDPGDGWESKFNALARRVLAVEEYLRSLNRPFGG